MIKKIDQLALQDLKNAFREYLDTQLVPKNQQSAEWNKFYKKLIRYCVIVDAQGQKMCYYKFHTCKYCNSQYLCDLKNWECPTRNNDRDANMCETCRDRLEDELIESDVADVALEDLIGKFTDENES